jgi:Trk K+ transport system NAD-binding subunit
VLITAIERGREVIRPTGDTVMCSGDRLMVLGTSVDLARLQQLAAVKP